MPSLAVSLRLTRRECETIRVTTLSCENGVTSAGPRAVPFNGIVTDGSFPITGGRHLNDVGSAAAAPIAPEQLPYPVMKSPRARRSTAPAFFLFILVSGCSQKRDPEKNAGNRFEQTVLVANRLEFKPVAF